MALPKSFCKEQDNTPPPRVFFSREILRMGEKGMKAFWAASSPR